MKMAEMFDDDLAELLLKRDLESGSGFEPDPDANPPKACFHQSHRPPTGMVIPIGQRYRHVCPGCGYKTYIRSHRMTC